MVGQQVTSQRHEHLLNRLWVMTCRPCVLNQRTSFSDSSAALHVNRLITGTLSLSLFLIRLCRAFQVNHVKLKNTKYINITHYSVPEMECLYTGIKPKCRPNAFYSAPQCSHCKRCTSYGNSVCLSVCLSATRRYCVKTTARSTVQFELSDSVESMQAPDH